MLAAPLYGVESIAMHYVKHKYDYCDKNISRLVRKLSHTSLVSYVTLQRSVAKQEGIKYALNGRVALRCSRAPQRISSKMGVFPL